MMAGLRQARPRLVKGYEAMAMARLVLEDARCVNGKPGQSVTELKPAAEVAGVPPASVQLRAPLVALQLCACGGTAGTPNPFP